MTLKMQVQHIALTLLAVGLSYAEAGRCFSSGQCTGDSFKSVKRDCFAEGTTGESWRQGGLNSNKPCVQRSAAKTDPHFFTWSGHRFSYQGECDLVMLHNPTFGNDLGLDIHIRTTANDENTYSFISGVGLKIGNDHLEVKHGLFSINGEENVNLPAELAGYTMTLVDAYRAGNNHPYLDIDLGNDEHIKIQFNIKLLAVQLEGTAVSFGDSVGLMGSFDGGAMLARDGKTVLNTDENEEVDMYAEEWQVLALEPKLFEEFRAPQLPDEKCRRANKFASTKERERHLVSKHDEEFLEKAYATCGRFVKDIDYDNCVFDVLATGDLDLALAGTF